jgi:hypothetical protein
MALDDTAFANLRILLNEGKGMYDDTRRQLSLGMYRGKRAYIVVRHNL